MERNLTHKITFAGVILAIVILMQFLKNISPYISGPVINLCLVIVTIELGIWWGVAFSVGVPLISALLAPAMTSLFTTTYGMSILLISIGNIVFILSGYFTKKYKLYIFIPALIVGAGLKFLLMWLGGQFIILPIFGDEIAKVVNNVFGLLQLFTALISVPLIVPVKLVYEKLTHKSAS